MNALLICIENQRMRMRLRDVSPPDRFFSSSWPGFRTGPEGGPAAYAGDEHLQSVWIASPSLQHGRPLLFRQRGKVTRLRYSHHVCKWGLCQKRTAAQFEGRGYVRVIATLFFSVLDGRSLFFSFFLDADWELVWRTEVDSFVSDWWRCGGTHPSGLLVICSAIDAGELVCFPLIENHISTTFTCHHFHPLFFCVPDIFAYFQLCEY